jgi:hypothetical protein
MCRHALAIMALAALVPAVLTAQAGAELQVSSIPPGAELRLNGALVGTTPITLSGLAPGVYQLSFFLRGFQRRTMTVNAQAGMVYVLEAELIPNRGYLSLSVSPAEAQLLIDGEIVPQGLVAVEAGVHRVSARLFGYETQEASVMVSAAFPASVAFKLEKAAFRVEELAPVRPAFNPDNPWALGACRIGFKASAPGYASLEILDAGGDTVAQRDFGVFETWAQGFDWDGRSDSGRRLPDGIYRVVLEAWPAEDTEGREGAEPPEDTEPITLETSLAIDSSLRIFPRSLAMGISGFLLCPDAATLPRSSVQASIGVISGIYPFEGSIPFGGSFRMALAADWEASMSVNAILGGAGGILSGGLKYRFLGLPAPIRLEGAAALSGRLVQGSTPAGLEPPASMLSLFLPMSISLPTERNASSSGAFVDATLGAGASLAFGDALPSWRMDLGMALGLQFPAFDIHISGRTSLGLPAWDFAEPPRLGLDLRLLSPALAYLGMGAEAAFPAGAPPRASARIELGFIF